MSAVTDYSALLPPLSREEARALTDEVKADAQALWRRLVTLYEQKVHVALGYSSWGKYCAAEFDMDGSYAYRLLDSGRVVRSIETHSPMGEPPKSERVARELAPLRDEPDALREAWQETVEEHGPEPTALQTREAVGRKMDVHFSSGSEQWGTPQAFFDVVAREFAFDVDVCATPELAKCATYHTPERDGLAQDWTGTCWMNPPYGDEIPRWVEKAHASAEAGATVVCLVPARVDTGWWWDHCRHAEIRFLRGRLKFGSGESGAPFPSALVVFGRPACVKWWEWR